MSLAHRSTEPEQMDTDCVDFDDYARCLHDLARVNVVTLTHRPTLAWLARETRELPAFSLLDVACGFGDLLRRIHAWAQRRGIETRLAGIDLNPWARRAATTATPADAAISWHTGDVFEHAERYDFIVSSQFTHHLTDEQIVRFIRWMETHATRGWLISDLHRHWLPYHGFGTLARTARWHHFVRTDGRISIARSFVPQDWRELTRAAGLSPDDTAIHWHVPFRICVSRRCNPP